jgi:hypothetical protein
MTYITYHNDITFLEILAMHTKCGSGLIVYHKNNGITTMKKHVEFNHSTLLKILLEEATNLAPRSSLDGEPNKKRAHLCSSTVLL